MMDRSAAQPDRLATVERDLGRLQAEYERAISAFKFDEANALQRKIGALEGERHILAASLPAPLAAPEPPIGVVPAIGRPRHPRSRRLGS